VLTILLAAVDLVVVVAIITVLLELELVDRDLLDSLVVFLMIYCQA
jgi:hypothetical protein